MFERTFSFWKRLVGRSGQAAPPVQDSEAERRVWVRYPADLETTFQPAASPPGQRLSAKVRDISRGGVNLVVNRLFEPAELLSIELPGSGEEASKTILACIVRVTQENPGEWSLGCVFSRELTSDDLQGFGARRQRHPPSDQRLWMRFPCQVQATYQKVSDTDSPATAARVLDISPTGVGLLTAQPVEAGTLLTLDLQSVSGTTTRTILACVVHVTAQPNGDYALGCNFIRELEETDLQALL